MGLTYVHDCSPPNDSFDLAAACLREFSRAYELAKIEVFTCRQADGAPYARVHLAGPSLLSADARAAAFDRLRDSLEHYGCASLISLRVTNRMCCTYAELDLFVAELWRDR